MTEFFTAATAFIQSLSDLIDKLIKERADGTRALQIDFEVTINGTPIEDIDLTNLSV